MSVRLITRFGLAALALAFAASGPAFATGHKTTHHQAMSRDSGDAAIDQLNAESLAAAQQGQNFTPPPASTPSSPAPAKGHGKTM